MTEFDEIASAMLPAYKLWVMKFSPAGNTLSAARDFVKQDTLLAQESPQVIRNIAQALCAYCGS